MRGGPALVLALLLAGCTDLIAPAATTGDATVLVPMPMVDPLLEGAFAVAFDDYDAGIVTVGGEDGKHKEYEYDARLRGRVWWPEAAGTYPLLVFLHGQHNSCAFAGNDGIFVAVDDCSDEEGLNTAYPNHLGYEYLATHLASNGYVVASILGYEVNRNNGNDDVGMWARGENILATLDAFRAGAQGIPADALARADVSRVGLMGHSRGGEGVVTAAHVNLARAEADRHALRGIVALAPTDFNERGVPGIALLSLVPYCDGDVSTLHGLRTFDHSRHLDETTPKVQVFVRGTNHNFYNSRWYDEVGAPIRPGDDAMFNPISLTGSCGRERSAGGWRWTPEETQVSSIVHVGGFLRWTAGGEVGLAPFFTGERALPDAACPAASAPCPDVTMVSAVLPGARRLVVVNDSVPDALALEGFDDASVCALPDCGPGVYSSAPALDLRWSAPATLALPFAAAEDWRAFDAFSFRVAVPDWEDPTRASYDVTIEIEDASGAIASWRASEVSSALQRTPDVVVRPPGAPFGMGTMKVGLNAVRVPLGEATIDLAQVAGVRLLFEGSGRALVTDLLVQAEPDVIQP